MYCFVCFERGVSGDKTSWWYDWYDWLIQTVDASLPWKKTFNYFRHKTCLWSEQCLYSDCTVWLSFSEWTWILIPAKEKNPELAQNMGLSPIKTNAVLNHLRFSCKLDLRMEQNNGGSETYILDDRGCRFSSLQPPHVHQWLFSSRKMIDFTKRVVNMNDASWNMQICSAVEPNCLDFGL